MAGIAAANTASMVLFTGNATNVVICEGFSINDAAFTAYTILPFLACHVFGFVSLAFQYRNRVPRKLAHAIKLDPRSHLRDPVGAPSGRQLHVRRNGHPSFVASFFGIDVWMISLPFAATQLIFDLAWDHYRYSRVQDTTPVTPLRSFLTRVVRAAALTHGTKIGAAIALAVVSNIGIISFTFSASLAGLLWRNVLEQKGIYLSQRDFARWNLLPLLVMTIAGLGFVSSQMAVLLVP